MKVRLISLRIFATALLLVTHSGPAGAITASFLSPNDGQSYGINAPIHYSGMVNWDATEGTPATIQVDYMFGSTDAAGRILDSEEATWTYHNPETRLGNWKNKNPATLSATQWQSNATPYFLRATPYTASSPYFINPGFTIYQVSKTLGDVS
jgi:hypothetical protein